MVMKPLKVFISGDTVTIILKAKHWKTKVL
jgi:hypothetical protein